AAGDAAESFAPIIAHTQSGGRLVDPIVIFGIYKQSGKVKRPGNNVLAGIDFCPRFPHVIRAEERALSRFHDRINPARTRASDSDSYTAELAFRQALCQLLPGSASVVAPEQAASRTARRKIVRSPAELPHCRINDIGVLRVDGYGGTARVVVHKQDL